MVEPQTRFVCGVDTGGTFTDCIAIDTDGGLWTAKTSSTPPTFEVGFFAGLEALAEKIGLTLDQLLGRTDQLVHGTTVATNALRRATRRDRRPDRDQRSSRRDLRHARSRPGDRARP